MGTPRGRKTKKTTFNFTPKKLEMDEVNASADDLEVSIIREKISVIQNDITKVECDAIVNAANVTLLGGGGIDKVIHEKAGPQLLKKCLQISVKAKLSNEDIRCYPGECEVTDVIGSNLSNCKFVFHTVGPDIRQNSDMSYNARTLKSCYENCLNNILNYNVRSIAFCCISTGIYGYPNKDAAIVALDSVIAWVQANHDSIEKIIFCTYLPIDFQIYNELLEQRLKENLKISVESVSDFSKTNNVETSIVNDPDFSISREGIPTKLHNSHNVCFANSALQILYALSTFHTYILGTSIDNVVIHGLRNIFTMMRHAQLTPENTIVANDTFNIVKSFNIPEYHDNDHFDVVEFIRYVLDNSFQKNDMNLTVHSIFKMCVNSSIVCNNCQKESTTSYVSPIFDLPIELSYEHQSIGSLLTRYFDERGYPRAEYRCEREVKENQIIGCDKIGTCNQSIQITDIGEYMIISLRIYHTDEYGRKIKFIPNLKIDPEIHVYDTFDLQGIIWHHGDSFNYGHYSCNVKIKDNWYEANDRMITPGIRLECKADDGVAPYVVIYKKRSKCSDPQMNFLISDITSNEHLRTENDTPALNFSAKSVEDENECDQNVYICPNCESDIIIVKSTTPKIIDC